MAWKTIPPDPILVAAEYFYEIRQATGNADDYEFRKRLRKQYEYRAMDMITAADTANKLTKIYANGWERATMVPIGAGGWNVVLETDYVATGATWELGTGSPP